MNATREKPDGGASGKRRVGRVVKGLVPTLIVLVAAAGVALVAWMPKQGEALPAPTVPPVNVEVLLVVALPEMADAITLPAVIEPNRVVRVPAEVSGRIEKICCQEGRPCRAGDALVLLNTDLLQAEYDRTKATLEFDQREDERIRKLRDRGVATPAEVDQARAKLAGSKAGFDAAKANLERATIYAPIGGVLDKVPVELGEYVSPGDTVGDIVDIDTVKVVVDVPERDVHFLTVGATEEVVLTVRGQEVEVAGRITYISELADPAARTSRVEISVPNRPDATGRRAMRSGQIVRVRLVRRMLKDVIMIPLASVIPLEEGKAVYVVEDGKAERREVELGFIKGWSVQILSGLSPGDELIVLGHRFVGPGQPTIVVARKEPQSQSPQAALRSAPRRVGTDEPGL